VKETAILQSLKELVENSIDASGSTDNFEICIKIYHHTTATDQLIIEVLDNGVGMCNPKLLLECFETTKCKTNAEVSSGKFGIGLSAVIMYANMTTKYSVRLEE
jgi:DNA topoisomerase VI subunit B